MKEMHLSSLKPWYALKQHCSNQTEITSCNYIIFGIRAVALSEQALLYVERRRDFCKVVYERFKDGEWAGLLLSASQCI